MAITRKFILKTGEVVDELTPESLQEFQQKIVDLFTPLAYEAVINETKKESLAVK